MFIRSHDPPRSTCSPSVADKRYSLVYDAYFEHGCNIGDIDVLVAIAETLDLNADLVRRQLRSDAALAEVQPDDQWSYQQGVNGVPFFIFSCELSLSGAQPAEAILAALDRAEKLTQH